MHTSLGMTESPRAFPAYHSRHGVLAALRSSIPAGGRGGCAAGSSARLTPRIIGHDARTGGPLCADER